MKRILIVLFLFLTSLSYAQQTDYVDFEKIDSDIIINADSLKIWGSSTVEFKILKPVDSVYLDARGMDFQFEMYHNDSIKFKYDEKKLWLINRFKSGETYKVSFQYSTKPQKGFYFLKRNENWNIWTQGQGKYTSNWLPSIDDVNDKIVFDLAIVFNEDFEVIANGKFDKIWSIEGYNRWYFKMQKPMSSYLVALAIGKYNKKTETSKSGIPLEYYYYPEDSLKVEPTYRYSKQMFDFLEEEIGFAYPWQNYKQVPVHDFLYAGMENTSCTIFSDAFAC